MRQEESLYRRRGATAPRFADTGDAPISGADRLRLRATDFAEPAPCGVITSGSGDPDGTE